MTPYLSNYDKARDAAAKAFLRYDQARMIRKFGLAHDADALYISFVGREYRVDRGTGAVTWMEHGTRRIASYNEAMSIYDVLCDAKPWCHLAHEWVNVASLSAIQGGTLRKDDDFFKNSCGPFTGDAAALDRACLRLHGRKQPKGDAAYELELFPFLPLILRFWEADEDFPASMQVLADKNTLDYLHYETLMLALSHLMTRLNQLSAEAE